MMMEESVLKATLFDHCFSYVQNRLKNIREAMDSAIESANDDNKSSAGDKHETGRAMAQLEQEKLSVQLAEAQKLSAVLNTIKRGEISPVISPGSLIITDHGNYFIAISAGKMVINNEVYFVISPASPIGAAFMQKKDQQAFIFNGQQYRIKKVC